MFVVRWMLVQNKKYVLVISGGGSKWLYACGVLKAMEELGLKGKIEAIYGVSAGALTGAYWASGWKAEDILEKFLHSDLFSFKNIALPPKMSLLKSLIVEELLKQDVKPSFEELEIPLYVGATDIWKAEFRIFSKWELLKPVLASMSIPGVFPAMEYDGSMLVDGGVLCNFPLEYAKKDYPEYETIGIYLWQFKKDQPVRNLMDTLLLSYAVSMQAHLLKDLDQVDYLFKRDLNVGVLDSDEDKIRAIFEQGYQDGIRQLTMKNK